MAIILVLMQPNLFIIAALMVVGMIIMVLLLSLVHWGILDKSNNLGVSAEKYWSERDDSGSYTHGSS